jgi:hypothetical protein
MCRLCTPISGYQLSHHFHHHCHHPCRCRHSCPCPMNHTFFLLESNPNDCPESDAGIGIGLALVCDQRPAKIAN